MENKEHGFIKASEKGRNPWWAYVGIILGSIAIVILLNQLINRVIMPWFKSLGLVDTPIGKDLIVYAFIGVVFGSLIFVLKVLHQKLHRRNFNTLINATKEKFRVRLFIVGSVQWGVLLLIAELITKFPLFENFLANFQWSVFLPTFFLTAIVLFPQTYWEELLFRGYLMQNIGRKVGNIWVANLIISLLFGVAHFGYGLGALIHSLVYSFFLIPIVLKDKGLERATGIHFINNFLLMNFFTDVEAITNSTFSWSIDILDLGVFVAAVVIMLVWTKAIRKAPVEITQAPA